MRKTGFFFFLSFFLISISSSPILAQYINGGASGGSGTPGGTNGQIQYNNAGSFGGLAVGGALTTAGGTLNVSTITAAQMLALPQNDIYLGNGSSQPAVSTLSAAIDAALGSTRGAILERGVAGWILLTPSVTAGQVLSSNGVGADPSYQTITGTGTVTNVTLAPGFTTTTGTCNTGTQAITTTGTISGQECIAAVNLATCTVNSNCTANANDTGVVLVCTHTGGCTFTLPNPASGTKGVSYQFGSDGVNGFNLATAGAAANFYGCTPVGGGATTLSVENNIDIQLVDDGTGYKCVAAGSKVVSYAITIGPGMSAGNYPFNNFTGARTITAVRCTPEVLVGGTATINVVKAASTVLLSSGTALASNTCNANTAAATDQTLTLSATSLAAGDRLGVQLAGGGWGSSNPGTVEVTVFAR